MSHTDAGRALELYKRFCRQTEKVVAYLSSARKVSHTINVPIPNLKHAPVSLAGALEEYLKDPNFEQNRIEYRENKKVADRGGSSQPVPVTDAKKERECAVDDTRGAGDSDSDVLRFSLWCNSSQRACKRRQSVDVHHTSEKHSVNQACVK